MPNEPDQKIDRSVFMQERQRVHDERARVQQQIDALLAKRAELDERIADLDKHIAAAS